MVSAALAILAACKPAQPTSGPTEPAPNGSLEPVRIAVSRDLVQGSPAADPQPNEPPAQTNPVPRDPQPRHADPVPRQDLAPPSFDLQIGKAIVVESPPWNATVRRKVQIEQGRQPKLKLISKKPNRVTDTDAWLETHGLALPTWVVAANGRDGNVPSEVPARFESNKLLRAIHHPDHAIFVYGRDFSSGRFVATATPDLTLEGFFDFARWRRAPKAKRGDEGFVDQQVAWAERVEGTLFVESGHNTYAASSMGKNAYISAVDAETGALLWRSKPLVSNGTNFIVRDGWILCGYGFTAERDYLYVLNARNGKVAQKLPLKSGPKLFFIKGDRLHVRTYNTDYVFSIR